MGSRVWHRHCDVGYDRKNSTRRLRAGVNPDQPEFSAPVYRHGLIAAAALAALTWPLSIYLRNVAIVDSLWSLMILLPALVFAIGASGANWHGLSPREILALALVAVWALRLSAYITWRDWGHGEVGRCQAIRAPT